jgi:hypothetical protein
MITMMKIRMKRYREISSGVEVLFVNIKVLRGAFIKVKIRNYLLTLIKCVNSERFLISCNNREAA